MADKNLVKQNQDSTHLKQRKATQSNNAKSEMPTANLKGLYGGPDWNPRQAATTVAVGDVVRLRKPHPCGSYDWKVNRIGADIGLTCLGCDHKVLLTRADFEKRFKNYLIRAEQSAPISDVNRAEAR